MDGYFLNHVSIKQIDLTGILWDYRSYRSKDLCSTKFQDKVWISYNLSVADLTIFTLLKAHQEERFSVQGFSTLFACRVLIRVRSVGFWRSFS